MNKFKKSENFKLTKINAKYNKNKSNKDQSNNGAFLLEEKALKPNFVKEFLSKRRIIQLSMLVVLIAMAIFVGVFGKNKSIKLILDGQQYTKKTNHFINSMLLDKLSTNIHAEEIKVKNADDLNTLVQENQVVKISTQKNITATISGEKKTYNTYADTLAEFLEEQKAQLTKLGSDYSYKVAKYDKPKEVLLTNTNNFVIDLVKTVTKKVEKTKDYTTTYVNNSKLAAGTTKVKQKGIAKKYVQEVTTTYVNGKKDKTTTKTVKVLVEGQKKIIEKGTKSTASSTNYESGDSVWDDLAKCESGGNWAANTGNGFYGGLQFMASTWQSVAPKVGVTVSMPQNASRAQQIKVASYLQKASGWGQWPACTAKLGLR
ncbi:resuscitation-promoting factor [Mycoplasma sp. P36-A1]|uniref:resuscitation-promoting factor n=1 Tax=Mycoplasma sp. P36-A1 TaxID=3252900 RepID=UPI003C2ED077